MKVLRARVTKGKLVLEEARTSLPEGTVVNLVLDDEPGKEIDLTGPAHAALRAALRRSASDFRAGREHAWEDVVAGRKLVSHRKR